MYRLTPFLTQANTNLELLDCYSRMLLKDIKCIKYYISSVRMYSHCIGQTNFPVLLNFEIPIAVSSCVLPLNAELQWFGKFHAVFLLNWQQLWEPSGNSDWVSWMWGVSHTLPNPPFQDSMVVITRAEPRTASPFQLPPTPKIHLFLVCTTHHGS